MTEPWTHNPDPIAGALPAERRRRVDRQPA